MHETGPLLALGAVAGLHPPGLEIAAVRAAGDLPVGVLARQPDLDVISLARGEAHVPGGQHDHPVRQAQGLQDPLGAGRHALQLLVGAFGKGDRNQLDLVELVLAQHPSGVLAGRTGLGAEAGGERRHPHRQVLGREDLAGRQVGQRHLGGGDQPQPLGGAEQVLAELRKLAGAV